MTDRKEGNPFDFEQGKPLVKQVYAAELQKGVLDSERKKAKIEIMPMPTDIFPPQATPAPAATTTPRPEGRKAEVISCLCRVGRAEARPTLRRRHQKCGPSLRVAGAESSTPRGASLGRLPGRRRLRPSHPLF